MASEGPYRVALAALFALLIGHRAWSLRRLASGAARPRLGRVREPGDLVNAILGLLAALAFLGYVLWPARLAFAALGLPPWLRWAGVATGLAGLALLHASQRALGAHWSLTPRLGARHELVRAGPYRRIRHPLYTALLLVQGSSLLIASNWAVGLTCLGATALDLLRKARAEEALLRARFGVEYERYCRVTGRFLPRLGSGEDGGAR